MKKKQSFPGRFVGIKIESRDFVGFVAVLHRELDFPSGQGVIEIVPCHLLPNMMPAQLAVLSRFLIALYVPQLTKEGMIRKVKA